MKTILQPYADSTADSIQFEIEMLQDLYDSEQSVKELSKSNINFLVVDDDYDLVTYIQDCLHIDFENIAVIAVGSGESALKEIGQKIPDVLITDLTMQGISGFVLIEELQKQKGGKDVELLVITGKELSDKELSLLKELNTSWILYKPFDSELLIETVKKLFNNNTEH